MKEFRTFICAGLLFMVFLVASCAHMAVTTSSIASIEEMNLLRSRGAKPMTSEKNPVIVSPSASGAPLLPDLLVKSVNVFPALPGPIDSGSSFTVLTEIQNKGKIQASSESIEQYYLSADKSYSSEDILLVGSRTVPIIESKQYSEGSTEVSIPASTPSGTYYLISCADDMKNISEKNEMNNCKAAKRNIQVTNTIVPISIPLNYDLQVTQGSSTDVSFSVNPGPANYTNISLNLQDILTNSITITPVLTVNTISPAAALPISMSMYIRIGASASTVCQDGLRYGPFFITGSSSSPTVNPLSSSAETSSVIIVMPKLPISPNPRVDPPSASAEPSSVNIINSGSFAMCIQVVSDIDASIHVGDTAADATQCNQPPANISGTWSGTYTCINQGSPNDVDQPITLTITQDGNRAQYIDDAGDTYEGTVCGSVFKFNLTSPDINFYTESGTFVLNGNGSATKTSTWRSVSNPNTHWGTCTDNLNRL